MDRDNFTCVCVCVCVSVRERERGGAERLNDSVIGKDVPGSMSTIGLEGLSKSSETVIKAEI